MRIGSACGWRAAALTVVCAALVAGLVAASPAPAAHYGAAVTLPLTDWLIDKYGWGMWYPVMVVFGVIGGCAMLMVMAKQTRLAAKPS